MQPNFENSRSNLLQRLDMDAACILIKKKKQSGEGAIKKDWESQMISC